MAGAYLKPSNRTVGIFIPTPKPDRATIPTTPDLAALLQNYTGQAAAATGEGFDPSPANIDAKTIRSTLPNGMSLSLLPKKMRGETVVATVTLRFGDQQRLMNMAAVSDLTADMLLRGLTKHTRQQIKDELDRLKARVSIAGSQPQATATLETTRANLPEVLALVAEVLTSPAFPKRRARSAASRKISPPSSSSGPSRMRWRRPPTSGTSIRTRRAIRAIPRHSTSRSSGIRPPRSSRCGASIPISTGPRTHRWRSSETSMLPRPPRSSASCSAPGRPEWLHARAAAVSAGGGDEPGDRDPDKANAFFIAGLNLTLETTIPTTLRWCWATTCSAAGSSIHGWRPASARRKASPDGVGSQFQASPLDQAGMFVTFAIYAPQNETSSRPRSRRKSPAR